MFLHGQLTLIEVKANNSHQQCAASRGTCLCFLFLILVLRRDCFVQFGTGRPPSLRMTAQTMDYEPSHRTWSSVSLVRFLNEDLYFPCYGILAQSYKS